MLRNNHDVQRFVKDKLVCLGVFQGVLRVEIKSNMVKDLKYMLECV